MDDKTTGKFVYAGGENNRKLMVQDRKKGRRVTRPMMIMTMITAIHLVQETIPMNARHHENMMYRDMIVSRMVRLYM